MREDLRRVLRGEAVSDVVQTDLPKTQASFPASTIPPTQKSFPISAQNFEGETATVVRPVPTFDKNKRPKSFNGWMYATLALVLVSIIGLGVYFGVNQSKQSDSSKNKTTQLSETQTNNNSTNPENVNIVIISNTNAVSPTPISTPKININGTWVISYRMYGVSEYERRDVKLKQLNDEIWVDTIEYAFGKPIYQKREPNSGKIIGNKITLYFSVGSPPIVFTGTIDKNTMKEQLNLRIKNTVLVIGQQREQEINKFNFRF